MIKFIKTEEILPVRNEILRGGKLSLGECQFPTDKIEGAFHLGYYVEEQLVSIVSFHPQHYGVFTGKGYQLRGMATLTPYQGKGLGTKLINFAVVYLKGQKAAYVWCNARKVAFGFYQAAGFEIVSDEFEVIGIGPHRVMYLKIQ